MVRRVLAGTRNGKPYYKAVPSSSSGGTSSSSKKSEEQLIQEMREGGKAYLKSKPEAFGGGIDPSTGIRYVDGKRVSVAGTGEVAGVGGVPTLAQAKAIIQKSKQKTSAQTLALQKAQTSPLSFLKVSTPLQLSTPLNTPKTGTGTFTKAVDVGGGKMQDVLFSYSNGRITGRKLLGQSFPQTQKFKEAQAKEKEARKILQQSIVPIPSVEQVKKGTMEILDIASGGYFSERKLDKKEEQLYEDIEAFNKKYGEKSLTQEDYNKAQLEYKSIEARESALTQEKDKLYSSARVKVFDKLLKDFGEERLTSTQTKKKEAELKKLATKEEKNLEDTNKKIQKIQNKKSLSVIDKLNLKRLQAVKKGQTDLIAMYNRGETPKMLTGDLPIIPATSIPSGVTKIAFVGKQRKAKGGKIITDIVFKTDKGTVGVAKGVSVSKGKEGASIILGRSGRRAFKFPSGKQKIIDLQSFIGREKTITTPTKLAVKTKMNILANSKKTGSFATIKKNINAMKQIGIGQIGAVKGKKFITSAGKLKKISVDDFASMSAILTKKDLSLIVGNSITGAGAKAKFIGLIKGGSKAQGIKFTASEKKQFAKALKKVVTATAGALAKTKEVPKITKAVSLVSASKLAVATAKEKPKTKAPTKKTPTAKTKTVTKTPTKTTIKTKATTKTKTKSKKSKATAVTKAKTTKTPTTTKTKLKAKTITITKLQARKRAKTKSKVGVKAMVGTRTRLAQARVKTKAKTKTRAKVKTKIKAKVKTKVGTRIRLKTKTKPKAKTKTVKAKPKAKTAVRVPKKPIIIPKKPSEEWKMKKKTRGRKKKVIQAYDVFARPVKRVKKRGRPKLIKVNKVPLSKTRARDLRNYITDTSLSRTATIKKTKGKPQTTKLKVPKNYAKKTSPKFRRYRTIKGKRKLLPKGAVVEKRKNILDTRQEKRKISLRKRIKQIQKKQTKRKTITRNSTRRTTKKQAGRPPKKRQYKKKSKR